MDVCTLGVLATTTLLYCAPPQICHDKDNVRYCQTDTTKPINNCNMVQQFWECKRPDGTIYVKEFKVE